jgi:hypothetical protein
MVYAFICSLHKAVFRVLTDAISIIIVDILMINYVVFFGAKPCSQGFVIYRQNIPKKMFVYFFKNGFVTANSAKRSDIFTI